MIDEGDLRQMSREERRHLARLLASIDEPHVLRDHRAMWRRRLALLLSMGSCVVLAAWIAVLMLTLPKHYTAGHWRGAWVGFDFALLLAFARHGLGGLARAPDSDHLSSPSPARCCAATPGST